ncbi:disks large homolog 3-like [Diadema antillarum]|uniref:disks large homolog 3-like n=1 Tax=Diadema antillarum TaxID=105358 RepID=UPI003A8A422D
MEDETNSQLSYEMRELSTTSNDSPPPPYSTSDSTSLDVSSMGQEMEDSFSVAESSASASFVPQDYIGYDFDEGDYDYPETLHYEIRKVLLEKDSRGFGFTVAGGSDSPYGALPVFITSLDPDGVAADSGEVRLGDRIVSVNGKDMDGKPHGTVVQAIKRAGGRVLLEVTEGPENIMNYLAFD